MGEFKKVLYEVHAKGELGGKESWMRVAREDTLEEARAKSKSLKGRSRIERVGMITVDTGVDHSKVVHRIVKLNREIVETDE